MKLIELEKSKLTINELAKLAKDGPVILTRKGQPLAAVKDLSHSDWEAISLANNSRFQKLIEASRRSFQEKGGISLNDLREELGLPPDKSPRRRKKN
jgi:hypothetical protein